MKNLLYMIVVLFFIYSCGNGTKNKEQNKNITVEQELNASKNDKEMVDLYNLQIKNFLKQEDLLRDKITQFKAINQKDSVDYSFYLLKKGQKESYKYSRKFIEENVNTLAGAYVFQNCIGKFKSRKIFSEKEIFEIFNKYNNLPQGVISETLSMKVNVLKALQPGEKAPMICLQDTTGKNISLDDFNGKYLIVDFWASWCCGCRMESPNLARIYRDFKSKGLEILGVSFDKKKDRWIEAINEDKLLWPQVCAFSSLKKGIGKTYNLAYIPQLYILDREGKIVCKGLRGNQLYNKIKELMAE